MDLSPFGNSMNFSASSIILNLTNVINPGNRAYSEFIRDHASLIGLSVLLIMLLAANFSRIQNPLIRPFLGLYALQLIPTISYTYTRWWGVVIIALLLNDKFMGTQRDRKLETFVWVIVVLNMALLNINVLNPISVLPTISFLGTILFCFLNIKFDLMFKMKKNSVLN